MATSEPRRGRDAVVGPLPTTLRANVRPGPAQHVLSATTRRDKPTSKSVNAKSMAKSRSALLASEPMSKHRNACTLALVLGLLGGSDVAGQSSPVESSDGWPDIPLAAKSATFAVALVPTVDPEGVMAAWAKPTAGVKIKTTRGTRMGRPVSIFVNYRNCKPDARGLCNVTTVWSLQKPGGRPEIVATSRVIVGTPAPRPGVVGISAEAPAFDFRPPDPPGTYVVRARTTDHVAKITLQTRADIAVTR